MAIRALCRFTKKADHEQGAILGEQGPKQVPPFGKGGQGGFFRGLSIG